jgi:hypothetical protein
MNELTQPKKLKSVTVKTDNFEDLANILRPSKSVFEMTDRELAIIDQFQDKNRGFKSED